MKERQTGVTGLENFRIQWSLSLILFALLEFLMKGFVAFSRKKMYVRQNKDVPRNQIKISFRFWLLLINEPTTVIK